MSDFPWLTVLVAVPLIGAVVVAALPRADLAKLVGLAVSVLTLGVGVAVALQYELDGGMQLTETHEWIAEFGVHYALGVDGLSLLMVLLTVVLVPIVLAYSWSQADEESGAGARSFFAWTLALEALSLAVFLATDVFLFYVVFEATLIPAYFLIGGFGKAGRSAAAVKFLMFQLGGGLVLLASVVGLYVVSAQAGQPSYLQSDLAALDMSTSAERWIFAGFLIAFVIKAPLFPLHTWLADTTEKATPGTSVLLVCVLDKIGTYGMLRFCLELFPGASQWATPLVVTLALISIVYGALLAMGQDDLLRLVGLTSLSHFGFITLGIFVFSSQGQSGAILYMVNHGLGTAALFLTAGYVIERRGTSLISRMGGMERLAPVLAGMFLIAGLATLSLPGLSPFISEMLVIIAAFDYAWWVGAVAVTGIVLAAIYVLWTYQRVMTGPDPLPAGAAGAAGEHLDDPAHREPAGHGTDAPTGGGATTATATRPAVGTTGAVAVPRDLRPREVAVLAPLVVGLVAFGFYPMPLFDVANPYVEDLMAEIEVADDAPAVPPGTTVEHDDAEGAH
ncbi:NADH-quinone oxidoreductase subunit M [Nocardioides marmotae]|uniref:NADH-quinone oxidoreductase subunit M n=1 Tax=Nocardioides marmotae TaxID=2663857 RepID=UPI0012B55CEE|nr:NADH-quinone oxidoreductase subunit M [Nocardioides marmotae]MBC9733003.1 NADH-quinone oxidoreductase subunit M [Nocardioides marmotae]MTB84117.1 NADH-quinone oxidoreductase subunit M [Nocardioides marmotae]